MAPAPEADAALAPALRRAEPRGPRALSKPDPGAALALAVHACMLEAGFNPHPPADGPRPATPDAPPPGWDKAFPDEWVFEYTHPGKAEKFVLHCSLQRASGRMLAVASEGGALGNRHMLGLQLANYVPGGAAALDADGWDRAVVKQAAILDMVSRHVTHPLLAMAADMPAGAPSGPLLGPERGAGWLDAWLPPPGTPQRRHVVAAATIVAAAAAVGVAALVARRRRGGGPAW
ncbi:hypothetical protein Rsub_07122 [Raphidocelis subcapitata]|uniref:PI31 proteasome regulator N-terminal domain-containing protein n=1 Tax=Raphidocelis subcapitata TaxID=307507 RepID=A0A2V0PAK6_9CHLO|nr:hypothetical protein Rsub_07122 [Raphidocelis subcapitata]|eukprot:GBF94135.1 hypothetical protein Rsub_07122 [Raphidocelis subcapitata]